VIYSTAKIRRKGGKGKRAYIILRIFQMSLLNLILCDNKLLEFVRDMNEKHTWSNKQIC